MNERQKKIAALCDGVRSSKEIAALCCDSAKYVQSTMLKFDLPRIKQGGAKGSMNGSYRSGRRIDRDGYVLVSAPIEHPYARVRKDRHTGIIYEHRLLMESKLGRFLLPNEVVDHIDGLRLHNDIDNLRLFSSNSEHLKQTITGKVPSWSEEGRQRMRLAHHQRKDLAPLNNYHSMKVSGDARLRQILLAALQLGKDSPFLFGTSHHLAKAGIFDLTHSSLQHELQKLYLKYA